MNIREQALTALIMINEEGRHSNVVINEALDKYNDIDPRDKALFVKLIHGSLEYQLTIDHTINTYSKTKVSKMRPIIRNVIRLSVYQIMFMDKIPDSAVCNEAVKMIKKTAVRNLSGFVNGILRNIARDNEAHIGVFAKDAFDNDICLKYSVQPWMLKLIQDTVGQKNALLFLEKSLERNGVYVRYIGSDEVKLLDNVNDLTKTTEWQAGKLIVQDPSSAMPVVVADIQTNDIVLDVCAAPGGKSIQASEHCSKVYACDLSVQKIEKIKENIDRLKVKNVETIIQDATVKNDAYLEIADVVLADLPCSGIGTISKKPEIKNRLTLEDCKQLAEIQINILENVCDYVKPGGKLVFSTCTLDHFENEDNTKAFLKKHPNFTLVKEMTLLPDDMPRDGFYVALFIKDKE